MVSAETKRTILALVGIVTFAVWVMQLINAVTIDYKFATYTTNTVNPGAAPGSRGASGNVWIVILPLITLTALVMFTLVRWATVSTSEAWKWAHIITGIIVIIMSVVIIIIFSVWFLAGNDWQVNNWNIAADERLCCIRPSVSIVTPIIPGCPVLFNNCSPDLSGTSDNSMSWSLAARWFFALLFVDLVLAGALVAIGLWIGNSTKNIYEAITTKYEEPISSPTFVSAPTPSSLGSGVNIRTISPVGTAAAISYKQR